MPKFNYLKVLIAKIKKVLISFYAKIRVNLCIRHASADKLKKKIKLECHIISNQQTGMDSIFLKKK